MEDDSPRSIQPPIAEIRTMDRTSNYTPATFQIVVEAFSFPA
jgi:hypothetical protein